MIAPDAPTPDDTLPHVAPQLRRSRKSRASEGAPPDAEAVDAAPPAGVRTRKARKTKRKSRRTARLSSGQDANATVAVKRPRGRPPYRPSDEQVAQVERMAALGLTQEEMACLIGIDIKTFRLNKGAHFLPAIEKGRARGKMSSGATLMREMGKGNMTALIWYEKTRHGMTEKVHTIVSSPAGGPVESHVQHSGAVAIGLFLPPNGRDVAALDQVLPGAALALPTNAREVSASRA